MDIGKKQLWYKRYVSEGILLASIPIVIFFVIFAFQYGYSNYYLVPSVFQSFSLPAVFDSGALMIPLIFLFIISFFSYIIPGNLSNGIDILLSNLGVIFVSVWLIYAYSYIHYFSILLLLILLFLINIFYFFIKPIYTDIRNKGNINKTNLNIEIHLNKINRSFFETISHFMINKISIYVILSFCFIAVAISYGYSKAENESTHYILKDTNYSVVRFFDDKVLLVEVNNNKIGKTYFVKSILDRDSIFISTNTGKYYID